MGKLVEIVSPFGSRRIPIEDVDWAVVKRMRAFYASPEGQKILDDYEEDERQFREVMQDVEMPITSVPINRHLFVRIINQVGQVLVPYIEEGDEEDVPIPNAEPNTGGGPEVRN